MRKIIINVFLWCAVIKDSYGQDDVCSDNQEICSKISTKEISSFCETSVGLKTCPTRCNKEPCCDLPVNKCCRTISGADVNKPCVFPFVTDSGIYHECNVNKDGPWCSTKVDKLGIHFAGKGKWGKCGPACPMAENHTTSYGCPVKDVLKVATVSGNDKKAVLCCSNKGDACYTPQPCLTFKKVRFHEAKEACEAKGNRLCSEAEIKRGECCESGNCQFHTKQVWLADEGVDQDESEQSELADAVVLARYGKCEWQKPKNKQKVGCYKEPIYRSSEATNGGITNNLSKIWKSCDCKGRNGLNYKGPRCDENDFCILVPDSKGFCKTDENWPGLCPCTCDQGCKCED